MVFTDYKILFIFLNHHVHYCLLLLLNFWVYLLSGKAMLQGDIELGGEIDRSKEQTTWVTKRQAFLCSTFYSFQNMF